MMQLYTHTQIARRLGLATSSVYEWYVQDKGFLPEAYAEAGIRGRHLVCLYTAEQVEQIVADYYARIEQKEKERIERQELRKYKEEQFEKRRKLRLENGVKEPGPPKTNPRPEPNQKPIVKKEPRQLKPRPTKERPKKYHKVYPEHDRELVVCPECSQFVFDLKIHHDFAHKGTNRKIQKIGAKQ